jgi:hypothetical protein
VSTHLVTDQASYPANWRLFLPEKLWDPASSQCVDPVAVAARRARCKIAEQVRHTEKWRLALDSLDQLHAWGVRVPLALADARIRGLFRVPPGR